MRFHILGLIEAMGAALFGLDGPSTCTNAGVPDCGVDGTVDPDCVGCEED